jgi:hypothetical protein
MDVDKILVDEKPLPETIRHEVLIVEDNVDMRYSILIS